MNPPASAASTPVSTAAPLPPFAARSITRTRASRDASARTGAALSSVLPSITTHTGLHWVSASLTVSASRGPVL